MMPPTIRPHWQPLLDVLGGDRSAMAVDVIGHAAGAPVRRRWTLVAGRGDGPEIPTLAAALLAERVLARTVPPGARDALLEHYLSAAGRYLPIDRNAFIEGYHGYALIRMMQALGAYGFRGLYEKKAHFIQSLPLALDNLRHFLDTARLPVALPALLGALRRLAESDALRQLAAPPLTVTIKSFSYRRGIPADVTGNGGGFVFDCRALPNPGRYEQYKQLDGRDAPVIEFLEREPAVEEFLRHVFAIIEQAAASYQQRNFQQLAVNFGCTGGRHRSVYCAERMAAHLQRLSAAIIRLEHLEMKP